MFPNPKADILPYSLSADRERREVNSMSLLADPVETRDPVCGMAVDPATAKHHSRHAGHTYHFCSARCRERFDAEPARYLSPAAREPAPPAAADVLWTCPMHPQIERTEPGSCPICGMRSNPRRRPPAMRQIPSSAR
jgi:YHS domain-containing protein